MLQATPTETGLVTRPGTFGTFTEALDYAARGQSGMNFHAPRGELTEALSYAALAEGAKEMGAKLIARGLEPGDRVGLLAETDGDFVRAFAGCLYVGLIPCPMPLPAAFGARAIYGDQLSRIVEVSGCRAVLAAPDYLDWITEALAQHIELGKIIYLGTADGLDVDPDRSRTYTPTPNALAYLQFSSGTTQAPKGIAVTHQALLANIKGMAADALQIKGDDRGVSWLPFYHDMGLVGCMLTPIATQMSMDYLATRDFIRRPTLWPTMIGRAGATISYSPSFGYELAARRIRGVEDLDLSTWRVAGIGGDMIKSGNLDEFTAKYAPFGFKREAFVPSYGMAEITLSITFAPLHKGNRSVPLDLDALEAGNVTVASETTARQRTFTLCGHVLPNHEIEIRDGDNQPAVAGRVGTVFARGPSMMTGYFEDPEKTAEALDKDGWLNTGDLGCFYDDELVLTGRAKDLIIVNGRNIWPQDLEWTVERRLDAVREGGVVAFSSMNGNGSDLEEEVAIVIECRTSKEEGREAIRAGADTIVRELHGISPKIVLSKPGLLPRTSSGKLSRSKAREMYVNGRFDM